MKKKLNAPMLAILFAIMTITACTRKLAVQSTPNTDTAGFAQTNKAAVNPIYTNNINARVLRSFHDSYGEVPDAKWVKSDNGFAVVFKDNGMNKTIYYKLNGSVDTEIFYYTEDKLPKQVRHLVKSHFYDYAITYVTEVRKNDAIAFYVKIEDASTIKTLKIVEEEWEVAETLIKR
jgi:hypothetical protein